MIQSFLAAYSHLDLRIRFVSRICIPSQHPTLLFSGSGDGTVRIWRYTSGELLHTENFKRDDTHIVTLPVAFSDKKNILVVLVEDSPVVHLLKLEGSTLKEVQILPLRASPYDAVFDAEDNLWVSTSNGVEAFSVGIDDTYSPNGTKIPCHSLLVVLTSWCIFRVCIGLCRNDVEPEKGTTNPSSSLIRC